MRPTGGGGERAGGRERKPLCQPTAARPCLVRPLSLSLSPSSTFTPCLWSVVLGRVGLEVNKPFHYYCLNCRAGRIAMHSRAGGKGGASGSGGSDRQHDRRTDRRPSRAAAVTASALLSIIHVSLPLVAGGVELGVERPGAQYVLFIAGISPSEELDGPGGLVAGRSRVGRAREQVAALAARDHLKTVKQLL